MRFDALVLAGGASTRMRGTDKAGLDVGGIALLDRVLSAVADAQHVVVVGPRRPTAWPVTFTIEEPAGSGPAAAIVHGLSLIEAPMVVVLAADLPFAATAVPKLIDALASSDRPTRRCSLTMLDAGSRCSLLIAPMHFGAVPPVAIGTARRCVRSPKA